MNTHTFRSILTVVAIVCALSAIWSCSEDPVEPVNYPPKKVFNPSPDDGATAGVDVDLTWSASDPEGDAMSFDVYFGVDSIPPVVSSGQKEKVWDPGVLEYDELYFWRVDCKDNKGNTTKGSVWRFTTAANQEPTAPTGPPPSVATDVASNAYNPGTLDYNVTYYWQIVAKDDHGNSTGGEVWRFTTGSNAGPNQPSAPSPANGSVNRPLSTTLGWAASTDPEGDPITYDVKFGTASPPPTVASGISGTTSGPEWSFTTVANQPPNLPSSPSPAHLSTGADIDLTLSWQASDPEGDPMTFDVYFGDTPSPSTLIANDITSQSVSVSDLRFEKLYYWRVDASDDHGNTRTGTVWRFTSRAGQWTMMTSTASVTFNDVWGLPGGYVYAVGENGTIIRNDGSSTSWLVIRTSSGQNLQAISGTAANSIFAAGYGGGAGIILNWNGISWSPMPGTWTNIYLYAVWAASATDVFVGSGNSDRPFVLHYNGTDWTGMNSSGANGRDYHRATCLWGTDASNVYMTTAQSVVAGSVMHWDGAEWNIQVDAWPNAGGLEDELWSVNGVGASDVYAVGYGGQLLHNSGSGWTNLQITGYFRDVWGSATDDVFVCGTGGLVKHFDGSTWTPLTTPTTEQLYGIWGDSYREVYVVGSNGLRMRYE
jgi:hypothetical protein